MSAPANWDETRAETIIAAKQHLEGALLPILHELQHVFGYIDPQAVTLIARALNLSRAEVHGVVSFYHDFKKTRPLGGIVKFCRAEACQARGAQEVGEAFEKRSGAKIDGGYHAGVSVETAYCLGNCALGPNALHDGEIHAGLDAEGLEALCRHAGGLS
jgi:formate dehydrogenase subunit gamma